jgi:hypothetical protein
MTSEGWGDPRWAAIEAEKSRRSVPPSDAGPDRNGEWSGWWKALLIADIGACLLSILAGFFILGFDELYSPSVSVIGAALLVIGPLNLALTPIVRGLAPDAGWVRPVVIGAKVLLSVVLLPLLVVGLALVGLVLLIVYALTHASG